MDPEIAEKLEMFYLANIYPCGLILSFAQMNKMYLGTDSDMEKII